MYILGHAHDGEGDTWLLASRQTGHGPGSQLTGHAILTQLVPVLLRRPTWKQTWHRVRNPSYLIIYKWHINNLFFDPSEVTFGSTKWGKLMNDIMHITCDNHKTESFVFGWLHPLAMFEITCFPAFVGASDVNLRVLSICELLVLCLFTFFICQKQLS